MCEDTGEGLCQPDGVPPGPLNPYRSPPITRINPPTSENIPPASDVPFLPGSRTRILVRRAYGRFSLTSLPLCLLCGLILKQSCTTPPCDGLAGLHWANPLCAAKRFGDKVAPLDRVTPPIHLSPGGLTPTLWRRRGLRTAREAPTNVPHEPEAARR